MMKRRLTRFFAVLVVCSMFAGYIPGIARAASVSKISVLAYESMLAGSGELQDPGSLGEGDTFAVWIVAYGVTDLQGVDLQIEYSRGVLDVDAVVLGDIIDLCMRPGLVYRDRGLVELVASNEQPSSKGEMIFLRVGFVVIGEGLAFVRFAEGSPELATAGIIFEPGEVETLTFWVGEPLQGPEINVTGVQDGAWYKESVTPDVEVIGGTIWLLEISKDGGVPTEFTSGTEISEEGFYVLYICTTSEEQIPADLELGFAIDKTKPVIEVMGVSDGAISSQGFTPLFSATDNMDLTLVAEATLKKGNDPAEPFTSGTPVADEGIYMLTVNATDAAGNAAEQVEVGFEINRQAPVITITGVQDGAWYKASVTPDIQVTGGDLTSAMLSKDVEPVVEFTSGQVISEEGTYVLDAVAISPAGIPAEASVGFKIDKTKPTVEVTGVQDGAISSLGFTPLFIATDNMDLTPMTQATLKKGNDPAEPFTSGTPVSDEGVYVLTVDATDAAGNAADQVVVGFEINRQAPVITVTGVQDGAWYKASVTPDIQVTGGDLTSAMLSKDVEPVVEFTSGQAITEEGTYLLRVIATSPAGIPAEANVGFKIDKTKPAIEVTGVQDGSISSQGFTPLFSATDNMDLAPMTQATLKKGNDPAEPFTSGTPVSDEGVYILTVDATDAAGNAADQVVVGFEINRQAPVITVTGVQDGAWYKASVTPGIQVTGGDLTSAILSKDIELGVEFTSGQMVSEEGTYLLRVIATSPAGIPAETSIGFKIDKTKPIVILTGVQDGAISSLDFTPVFSVTDNMDLTPMTQATLKKGNDPAEPFTSGTPVSDEGVYVLTVDATDAAGNAAEQVVVRFEINRQVPVITVTGVQDGAWYKVSVTPEIGVAGGDLTTAILSKDGELVVGFTPGQVISEEGTYVLDAVATSPAGIPAEFSVGFKIDKTKPVIEVAGVSDGAIGSQGFTPLFSATDNMDQNVASQATLKKDDGPAETFTSGTTVSDEGVYVLTVNATDAAGNAAEQVVVGFEINRQVPVVTVVGVQDGAWYKVSVTPEIEVTGGDLTTAILSKDGELVVGFTPGQEISEEGTYVLDAVATSPAGIPAELSIGFRIDKTKPVIEVTGVSDGAIGSQGFAPFFSAIDSMDQNVAAQATLKKDDGPAESFTSGTVVSEEGVYVLTVNATDAAGNAAEQVVVGFEINRQAPVITVTGVQDGAWYKVSVTPEIEVTGGDLTTAILSKDGELVVGFTPGQEISEEGTYVLDAIATSPAGIPAELSIGFKIDKTKPVIEVAGVSDGAIGSQGFTPLFTATDNMDQNVAAQATLKKDDGPAETFTSGTVVSEEGVYVLTVNATDAAGNAAEQVVVGFEINRQAPVITVTGVQDDAWYKVSVTPEIQVTGGDLTTAILSKDGELVVGFTPGQEISEEGTYVLDAVAISPAGIPAEASVGFKIDKTKPVIAVAGVENGDVTFSEITPNITVSDNMDADVLVEITLKKDDGPAEPFASGTVVSEEGIYVLTVNATDAAGNAAPQLVITFEIDKTVPVVTVTVSPIYAKVGPVTIVATSTKVLGEVPVLTITPMNGVSSSVSLQMKTEPGVTPVRYEGVYQVEEDTPEGVAQVTLDAVDVAGNVSGDTTTFTVDRTCELTMVYHDASAVLGPGASFRVFAVGEPDAQLVTVDLSGLASVGESVALQEGEGGTYYSQAFQIREGDTFDAFLSVNMVDRAGNTKSVVTARELVVDTQVPTLSLPVVVPRLAKGGSTVRIEVQSSERVNAQVSIGSIISGKPMTCAAEGDHWLCVADIVVPLGVDGEFLVTIGASDLGGNTFTVPAGKLVVDNVAPNPRILVTSGTRGTSGFYTSPVSVQIDCDGADAGEAIINYTIKRNDGEPQSDEFAASLPTGSQGPIDLTFNEDGKWSVAVTAVDGATNVSKQVTQHIQIDKTLPGAPIVTVRTVDGGTLVPGDDGKIRTAQHSVDVHVNAPAGSDEPLLYAEITVNGAQESFKVVPAEGYTHRVKLNTTGVGQNTLKVLLVDRAGNRGSSWNGTVITDVVPPSFALEFALDSSTGIATAAAWASEALSGPPALTILVGVGAEAVLMADAEPMTADDDDPMLYTCSGPITLDLLLLMAQGVSVNATGQDAAGNKGSSTLILAVLSDGGGIVGSEAAEATVEEGTFDEETEINISSLPTTVDDDNTAIAAVALSAIKVSTGEDVGTFANPVTVTLRISVPLGVDPDIFAEKTKLGIQVRDENGIPSYFEPVVGVDIEAPPTKELSIDRTVLYITARFLHFSEWAVLLDNTPPVLTVSAPGQNDTISTTQGHVGGKVRVSFSATDTQSSPMEVEVRLNGAIIATFGDVEGEAQVDIDLLDSNWVVGPNTIQVAATDSSGNSATKEVSVHYDVTPPAVALDPVTSPSNASSVTISGSVGVVDAGAAISVERGDGLWSVAIDADSEGLFSVTAPLEEGTNTFTVTAVDLAGNVSDSSLVTVVRDTVAPAITANVPRVTAVVVVDVTGSVDEPVSAVTVSLDGGAAVAATITGTSFSAPLDLGVTGEHTIEITATDSAGNQASKSYTVRYDPDVPVISVTSDIPTLTNEVEITVEGTSDPGATVTVTLDGEIIGVVSLPGDGAFSVQVPLPDPDGDKTLSIRSLNPTNGLYAESVFTIERDTVAPVVTVDPATPQSTNTSTATIVGSTNETITGLSVNGVNRGIGADGRSFTVAVTLTPGQNTFTIQVTDRAGNAATHELTITYTPPTTPSEPSGTVPAGPTDVIAAEEGGTARNEAAGIEVTIPAQATKDDIRAVLREALVGVAPVAQYRVAKLYDIEFKSAATGESITVFESPYTLRLTFDPTVVSEENRQSLKVYYWSEAAAVWVEVPSTLDEASSTFTVTLPHATVFAVMADTSATDTSAIASVPSTDLRGHKWLATGSGPAGASLRIVVNGVVQATTTVNEAGLWQEWVTLKEGHNWVFAATTGGTARASAEVYPVVRSVILTDIAGHWAEDNIIDLVERNVVTGYEDDTFRTESDITRAEFCALVVRTLGLTPDSDGAKGFIDAEEIPAWAASFIGAAAKEGIVKGYEDDSFRADAQITRAEMAVMIWRALKLKDISDPDISVVSFTDDGDIADWAREGIEQSSAYGIIKGYEDGSFGPDRLATRAESATMLMRLLRVK